MKNVDSQSNSWIDTLKFICFNVLFLLSAGLLFLPFTKLLDFLFYFKFIAFYLLIEIVFLVSKDFRKKVVEIQESIRNRDGLSRMRKILFIIIPFLISDAIVYLVFYWSGVCSLVGNLECIFALCVYPFFSPVFFV